MERIKFFIIFCMILSYLPVFYAFPVSENVTFYNEINNISLKTNRPQNITTLFINNITTFDNRSLWVNSSEFVLMEINSLPLYNFTLRTKGVSNIQFNITSIPSGKTVIYDSTSVEINTDGVFTVFSVDNVTRPFYIIDDIPPDEHGSGGISLIKDFKKQCNVETLPTRIILTLDQHKTSVYFKNNEHHNITYKINMSNKRLFDNLEITQTNFTIDGKDQYALNIYYNLEDLLVDLGVEDNVLYLQSDICNDLRIPIILNIDSDRSLPFGLLNMIALIGVGIVLRRSSVEVFDEVIQ